ncbi:MAG TPA: hypothetical protein VK612_05555, partial [Pyrinomonadaceae bacterium]|nr:hypothetical protein [Pyrinomonadaceae bacterium]
DLDYIYSLYNTDNDVAIHDSLEEAERVKRRWVGVVPVDGPFQHTRPEATLITAARRAIIKLTRLYEKDALIESQKVEFVAAELQRAIEEFFKPFPDLSLPQLKLIDSHQQE